MELSHIDKEGKAKMVDVSEKEITHRKASAEAFIRINRDILCMISEGRIPKGDVLTVARIAAIQGAKKTSELIPLCHPLPLDKVDVEMQIENDGIRIITTAAVTAKTGVEMEALTAASIAALTIYDMAKAVDKSMTIEKICLLAKSGGRSGEYKRRIAKQEAAIVGVCLSKAKGTTKKSVGSIKLIENHGVEGDAHAGDGIRQVSIIGIEVIRMMRDMGFDVGIGDFAENITTEGLVLKEIPVGTEMRIRDVELRVSQIGKECHRGCAIRELIGDCPMPREGIFAEVVKGGEVRVGDTLEIL